MGCLPRIQRRAETILTATLIRAVGGHIQSCNSRPGNASGVAASVSGGVTNTASGFFPSVAGGCDNTAGGFSTVVIGGNGVTDNNNFSIAPQPPFPRSQPGKQPADRRTGPCDAVPASVLLLRYHSAAGPVEGLQVRRQ